MYAVPAGFYYSTIDHHVEYMTELRGVTPSGQGTYVAQVHLEGNFISRAELSTSGIDLRSTATQSASWRSADEVPVALRRTPGPSSRVMALHLGNFGAWFDSPSRRAVVPADR